MHRARRRRWRCHESPPIPDVPTSTCSDPRGRLQIRPPILRNAGAPDQLPDRWADRSPQVPPPARQVPPARHPRTKERRGEPIGDDHRARGPAASARAGTVRAEPLRSRRTHPAQGARPAGRARGGCRLRSPGRPGTCADDVVHGRDRGTRPRRRTGPLRGGRAARRGLRRSGSAVRRRLRDGAQSAATRRPRRGADPVRVGRALCAVGQHVRRLHPLSQPWQSDAPEPPAGRGAARPGPGDPARRRRARQRATPGVAVHGTPQSRLSGVPGRQPAACAADDGRGRRDAGRRLARDLSTWTRPGC